MKKHVWGTDPNFLGPRDKFKNHLIYKDVLSLKKYGSLLDFGCGSGNLISYFSKSGFKCTGIDKSPDTIKFIKSEFKKKPHFNTVKLLVGSELSLYSLRNKFDIVVTSETLEHVKNPLKAVNGFYKILKPKGLCVVSVPAHTWLWDDTVDKYVGHYRRYESDELFTLFRSAKFKVLKVYYWGFPLTLLWDKFVLYPLYKWKIKNSYTYSNSGFFSQLLRLNWLKSLFSLIFYFDSLFNWTKLGVGIILIAQK